VHRLSYEDPVAVERIARYIATLQLQSTQYGGKRPYGVTTLVCGFDATDAPHIYETLPNGAYTEWRARTVGRHDTTTMEYIEKHWKAALTDDEAVRLAVAALLEVVENGAKNLEVELMRRGEPMRLMPEEDLQKIIESLTKK
jgi:20S proteasome subunit alpha 4